MKAFIIESPKTTRFVEMDIPEPQDGEVLLRTGVLGYCGTDLNIYRGTNPLVTYPRIPGHEIGAVIERVGPGVPDTTGSGMPVTVYPGTHCGQCAACR